MPNVKSRTTSPPASPKASVNAAVVFVKYASSGEENVTAVVAPCSAANSAAAAPCTGSLKLIKKAPRAGSASDRSVEALEMIGTCPSTVSMSGTPL